MTVYLDSDYRAHAAQDAGNTLAPYADADGFFDGKCAAFIAGYRVVPEGETWVREDGHAFPGPMISPIADARELEAMQYREDIAALDAALIDAEWRAVELEYGL